MKLTFWGVRGSFPVCHPKVQGVGGNTSCVDIEAPGVPRIIIDAGTGLRNFGRKLMGEDTPFAEGMGQAALLISHTHWDHIQGFMFFEPLFREGNACTVYARATHDRRLQSVFEGQADQRFFNYGMERLSATMSWKAISEESRFNIGAAQVVTARLNHPGVALGYRIEHQGKVIVYITDTAPYDDQLLGEGFHVRRPAEDPRTLELITDYSKQLDALCAGADIMLYDTFFTDEQYRLNPHWGHSTPEVGIALARRTGVKRFFFFHHHPEAWDEVMVERVKFYNDRYGDAELSIELAREGLTVEA